MSKSPEILDKGNKYTVPDAFGKPRSHFYATNSMLNYEYGGPLMSSVKHIFGEGGFKPMAKNIPSPYQFAGTKIYRDTTEIPSFRQGGIVEKPWLNNLYADGGGLFDRFKKWKEKNVDEPIAAAEPTPGVQQIPEMQVYGDEAKKKLHKTLMDKVNALWDTVQGRKVWAENGPKNYSIEELQKFVNGVKDYNQQAQRYERDKRLVEKGELSTDVYAQRFNEGNWARFDENTGRENFKGEYQQAVEKGNKEKEEYAKRMASDAGNTFLEYSGINGLGRTIEHPIDTLSDAGQTIVDIGMTAPELPYRLYDYASNFYTPWNRTTGQNSQYTDEVNPITGQPYWSGAQGAIDLASAFPFFKLGSTAATAGVKGTIGGINKIPALTVPISQSSLKSNLKGALGNLKSFGEEVVGSVVNKNRAQTLREAEDWMTNWMQHPVTQQKIQEGYKFGLHYPKNPTKFSNIGSTNIPYTQRIISSPAEVHNLGEGIKYSSGYNAAGKLQEYPLGRQAAELLQLDTPGIHKGNFGVSFTHHTKPGLLVSTENTLNGGISPTFGTPVTHPRYGNWVSRTLNPTNRFSTGVHELTHDAVKADTLLKTGQSQILHEGMDPDNLQNLILKHADDPKVLEDIGYYSDPAEIHARVMEARKHFNLTPEMTITPDKADDMMTIISKGKTPIEPKWAKLFPDSRRTATMFNKAWMAPAVIGGGTAATLLSNPWASDKQQPMGLRQGGPLLTNLTPKEEKQFQQFYQSLPDNLMQDDPEYDIRGYWDSEGRPQEFNFNQPKEDDGYYRAYSINQNTGEYLKSPAHETFQHAIDIDRKIGYRPVTNVQGRNIATENESIIPPQEQSFLANTQGPVNFRTGGSLPKPYSLPEDSFKQGGRGLHNSIYASTPGQYPQPYENGGSLVANSAMPMVEPMQPNIIPASAFNAPIQFHPQIYGDVEKSDGTTYKKSVDGAWYISGPRAKNYELMNDPAGIWADSLETGIRQAKVVPVSQIPIVDN